MKRRLSIVIISLMLLVACLSAYWRTYARRHAFCGSGVCVYYDETADRPGDVVFEVRNRSGAPVAGVAVNTLSHSGWAAGARTDRSGIATFQPSEWEVLAVQVNDEIVEFWRSPIDLIAGPDTGGGVRFVVRFR